MIRTPKVFNKPGQQVRTTQLQEAAHKTMKEQLVPMAREMQRISIGGDAREVFYYKRKSNGKICSCVTGEGSAYGECHICYKTGIVGGYEKLGTSNVLFNSTNTFLSNNIKVLMTDRPQSLVLEEGANSGYILWSANIPRNKGVDLINISSFEPVHSSVKIEVLVEASYVLLTKALLETLFGSQTIKITLNRLSSSISSPKLSNIHFRFKLKDSLLINTDWPRTKDLKSMSDYGIYQGWQSERINIDSSIGLLSTEDFFYYPKKNQLWKCVETEGHDPLETNIGWEATVRLVQDFEVMKRYKL